MDKELLKQLRKEILRDLEQQSDYNDSMILNTVQRVVAQKEREVGFRYADWHLAQETLYNSLKRLDIIEDLMQDEEVTEVMINGPDHIFYEKNGCLYPFDKSFESETRLREIIDQIVGEHNRRVNTRTPIVDTRLRDGSRVHIVLGPISLQGPVVTIRKFSQDVMSLSFLVQNGTMRQQEADYLERLVKEKQTILITGGTGSGKTTLLNALSAAISRQERVITIEDSAELRLQNSPNLIRLECRDATEEGALAVTMRDLIKASLRMRPDRIIVGEVRGPEALDLLQTLNTGHQGSLSTLHANTCRDSLSRLETMVLMAMDLPLKAIRAQIASGIQVIAHVKKYPDGSRKLDEIIHINGMNKEEIMYHSIYKREEST
ncbi:MAG: CpaF family protein [Lachnospiraceae bacterium]